MKRKVWMGQACAVRGEVSEGDLEWLKQKKFLKVMNLQSRWVLQAVHRAGEISENPGGENCGVIVSLGELESGFSDWEEADRLARHSTGKEELSPAEIGPYLAPLALIPRLPNTIAGHVAREFSATGPSWTSGEKGLAISQAARWIADGECERVIVAGLESDGAVAVILSAEPAGKMDREILSGSDEDWKNCGSGLV